MFTARVRPYRPCTRAINTAVCTRPCVTTYKLPCLRPVYTTVYKQAVHGRTRPIHGLYAVYTSCTRAVNTAVYSRTCPCMHSRTQPCTRPCASCKQPCTRSCTCVHFPYTAVKFGTEEGTFGAEFHPNRCNDKGVGPQKLKFLLRFDQNVEYKRHAGAYLLRDFHKICRVCSPFQDALDITIWLDLLEVLWSYGGFNLRGFGFPQIFSAP